MAGLRQANRSLKGDCGMSVPPKLPIPADVADVVGAWAERVDNRSLLKDKFVLHKSWPVVRSEISGKAIKMDDASRWCFIRMAANGGDYLQHEQNKLARDASKEDAKPENTESGIKAELVGRLKACACRRLPTELVRQKLEQAQRLSDALAKQGAAVVYGELRGRLAINLSDSLVQNAGICLDRHTGIPFIPGSAVKGVTRHVALAHLRAGDLSLADFRTMFGSAESDFKVDGKCPGELADCADSVPNGETNLKGGVDFLAAYPVGVEPQIAVDISNVHHPDYYASGKVEDLGKEKPLPNTFPTVEVGARFAFCIAPNSPSVSPERLARARDFLLEAITAHGIGAKTAAGYGWFKDVTAEMEEKARQQRERDEAVRRKAADEAAQSAERERQTALTPCQRILEEWAKSTPKGVANSAKIARFDALGKSEQTAIVEALRGDGLGAEVWAFLKAEEANPKRKVKHAPAAVSAIRRFVKAEKMERLP